MNQYTKDFRWIRTRTDLILFAQAHCESNACKRAFTTGKVVVLGGFSSIPPSTNPGWILFITSIHGRTWIIGVVTDDIKHCYHVRILYRIPWEKWVGSFAPKYGLRDWLRDGDNPSAAAYARRQAREIYGE